MSLSTACLQCINGSWRVAEHGLFTINPQTYQETTDTIIVAEALHVSWFTQIQSPTTSVPRHELSWELCATPAVKQAWYHTQSDPGLTVFCLYAITRSKPMVSRSGPVPNTSPLHTHIAKLAPRQPSHRVQRNGALGRERQHETAASLSKDTKRLMACCLRAQLGGGDDEVHAHCQEHQHKASPAHVHTNTIEVVIGH